MSSESYRERVINEVTEKVTQRRAVDVDDVVVRDKAAEAVDELLDAPVQTFAPLLAENAVLSDLHAAKSDDDAPGRKDPAS
jgi:hypothetical protein